MLSHDAGCNAMGNALRIAPILARLRAGLLELAADLRVSLDPRSEQDVRIVDEQLAIARQGTWSVAMVLPLGATLIALANSPFLPMWRTVLWPVMIALVCTAFDLAWRYLQGSADASRENVARRARVTAAMTFAQSVAWCSMGWFLWTPDAPTGQTLLFLVLACSLSGWSSMGAIHFATGVSAFPVYLVALTAMPLLGGSPIGGVLSGLCAAFWFMMAMLFVTNYRTREKMLRLVDERDGLIGRFRTAKEESDQARERAEAASRAKSQFLANMSHELRTPLNAILGFSEIIQTEAMGPAGRYGEYGGYINGSGKHLLALINDILDLAKIEAGRLVLHDGELELRATMEGVVLLMSAQADAARVALVVDMAPNFPRLWADERAVRQILTNLTSNAVKFTPPGGRVVLFARCDGELCFGVIDDGVGIAPEDHGRVFESFGQGRHDAVLADQGTGLGLPIVRGLAEAMGGHVTLESAPDRGTLVTISLPFSRARTRLKAAG
jgi:two-component system, cell cycle sensor histidine kinase PleC